MSEKCNHVFGIFGKNEVVECVKCGLEVDQVDLITENAELRKRIKELVQAGNELDGLLVTIMQQEYVTGTLPFTDHGRSFASSAHDKWQSIVEASDADNG